MVKVWDNTQIWQNQAFLGKICSTYLCKISSLIWKVDEQLFTRVSFALVLFNFVPKRSQFTHFYSGKIWFGGFAPCKRIDILQLWMDARFSAILTLNISLNPTMCIVRFMHFYLHGKLLMDARFSANDGEFAILIFARMWNWESRSSCFLIFSLLRVAMFGRIFNRRPTESTK